MTALAIIGCTFGGAGLGFVAGAFWPTRGPDDLGFGTLLNMGVGTMLGGGIGCIVGSVVFT